jgi:hypothetical protein
MKLNLLLDNAKGVREEYLNLDPFAEPGKDTSYKRSNLKELSEADDGEVEELIAIDVIDYYPPTEVNELLSIWSRKLAHGGSITIGFTDLYQLVKAVACRILNLEEANTAFHGVQDKAWRIRRSTLSIDYVAKVLESLGLRIKTKRLYSNKAVIKAVRP